MDRPICLGLLGLAGNYRPVNYFQLLETLSFVLGNVKLVDLSADYGIEHNLVEATKKVSSKDSISKFIYKVGCNYEEGFDVSELVERSVADIGALGEEKIDCILFHRPSQSKLRSEVKFFHSMRLRYPDVPFGMCTNSGDLYSLYKSHIEIDVVQLALNPLDYDNTSVFLNELANDSIIVQARSILSSGLLSGKYDGTSIFTDGMRKRYHEKTFQAKYQRRIKKACEVVRYITDEYGVLSQEVPIFLYSIFEKMPFIHCVIRGGSSLNQIRGNLAPSLVDENTVKDVIRKMESDWSCEYV